MSPGVRTLSQMDLPMVIEHPDFRCPVCGRRLVLRGVDRWQADGRVPLDGLRLSCVSEPKTPATARYARWHQAHWETPSLWTPVYQAVQAWFNQFYRYRKLPTEAVSKKKRLKWRRG